MPQMLRRPLQSFLSAIFSSFCGAIVFWVVDGGVFPNALLSQDTANPSLEELPTVPSAAPTDLAPPSAQTGDSPVPPPTSPPVPLPAEEISDPSQPQTSQFPPPTFSGIEIPPTNEISPEVEAETSQQFRLYRLDIGDSIAVTVRDFPEFNFTGTIDPEGNILVPVIGRMSIIGLTLEEVQAKLSYELYQRYLKEEPEVIATLVGSRPAQLTILGEVVRPGYYIIAPGAPITSVLLAAGGGTPKADLRKIVIRRPLVDGTIIEQSLDLYTPLLKGTELPDFRVQGGDTVIVSQLQVGKDRGYDRSLVARTTLTQQTITVRLLVPSEPAGIAVRNLRLANGSNFLDAIASLPPASSLAVKEEVTLMRFDPERGSIVTQTLNPTETLENGDITQYVPLQDQDVIIVGRTVLGKVLSGFRVISQPIRDIFGFTDFIDRIERRF